MLQEDLTHFTTRDIFEDDDDEIDTTIPDTSLFEDDFEDEDNE